MLSSHSSVFFLNTPSPRTLWRALVHKTGLYQAAYHPRRGGKYRALTEQYVELVYKHKPFSDFWHSEIEMGPLFEAEIVRLFRSALPKLLFEIDHAHQFFSAANSLRSVLLDEDANASKNAFCQVARQYHVASFIERHGALGHQIGVLPLAADWLFVWGRAQRNKLIKWGAPPDRLIVSGCSRFGHYQKLDDHLIRRQVAKQLKLDPSKKIILIAFSSVTVARGRFVFEDKFNRNIESAFDVIAEILAEFPVVQVVIKARPGDEGLSFFIEWAKKNSFHGRVCVLEHFDPLILAKAADFLVVYASTYAVEGFALGKPVICLHDQAWDLLEEFRTFSIFNYADDLESLRKSMQLMIQTGKANINGWEEARRECLNEGDMSPEKTIASYLMTPKKPEYLQKKSHPIDI